VKGGKRNGRRNIKKPAENISRFLISSLNFLCSFFCNFAREGQQDEFYKL